MNAPAPPAPGPLSASEPWNLVSDGYAEAGFECASCGRLAARGPSCPTCGASMTREDDIVERALEEAVQQSATVKVCIENADLDVLGRIGALLRF